jgi:hypothetical protein
MYRVTFTTLPGSAVPEVHALRRLLKVLLRSYRFRAVRVEELDDATDPPSVEPVARQRAPAG